MKSGAGIRKGSRRGLRSEEDSQEVSEERGERRAAREEKAEEVVSGLARQWLQLQGVGICREGRAPRGSQKAKGEGSQEGGAKVAR